jgi:hypothetical protein
VSGVECLLGVCASNAQLFAHVFQSAISGLFGPAKAILSLDQQATDIEIIRTRTTSLFREIDREEVGGKADIVGEGGRHQCTTNYTLTPTSARGDEPGEGEHLTSR